MKKNVSIFLAGQQGDIMSAMSVLKYRDELWGDHNLIWYADKSNFDLFKYQDIELREFPRGFGYPIMVAEENKKLIDAGKEPVWEDWAPLVDENNHLNIELAKNFPSLAGINLGYFPAPHQMSVSRRHGIPYPLISKKVFGLPDSYEWHPVLEFSKKDYEETIVFRNKMPRYDITICIESMAGSGQSILSDSMIRNVMGILEERLINVNFVFVSDKYLKNQQEFPEDILNKKNCFFAGHFSVRQCALIVGMSDLLISVSSGITVSASCWANKYKGTTIIQYTGSSICSTQSMALGKFYLVTTDEKPNHVSENEFYDLLKIV